VIVGAALAGLVIGFLVGLLAFRIKSRWCPRCGEWTLAGSASPDEERRVREVVEANDPMRGVAIGSPRHTAAELRRLADTR
jgi:hypothetical protein